jgi:hypothetical protein
MLVNSSRPGARFSRRPVGDGGGEYAVGAWAAVLTSPMETLYLPVSRSAQLVGTSAVQQLLVDDEGDGAGVGQCPVPSLSLAQAGTWSQVLGL